MDRLKSTIVPILSQLNKETDLKNYHRLVFEVYERGFHLINYWKTINEGLKSEVFYNRIKWTMKPESVSRAMKLYKKVLSAEFAMKSSNVELEEKDTIHYFKKHYKEKVKLLDFLRNGNRETFYSTYMHYVDVLHPVFK